MLGRLFTRYARNAGQYARYKRPPSMLTQSTMQFSTGRDPYVHTIKKVGSIIIVVGYLAWLARECYKQTGLGTDSAYGQPTPINLKDPKDPDRMVFDRSELTYDGQGNGHEGRSRPVKYMLTLANGEKRHGYDKKSDTREGLLNEMVYHLLAHHLLPDSQPMVKLIEHSIDEKSSKYSVWIESIGDNSSLLQLAKEFNASPQRLNDSPYAAVID